MTICKGGQQLRMAMACSHDGTDYAAYCYWLAIMAMAIVVMANASMAKRATWQWNYVDGSGKCGNYGNVMIYCLAGTSVA